MNPTWRTVSIALSILLMGTSIFFLFQKEWNEIIETDVSTLLPNDQSTSARITRTLVNESQGRSLYIIVDIPAGDERTRSAIRAKLHTNFQTSSFVESFQAVDQTLFKDLFQYVAHNNLYLTFPKWFSKQKELYLENPEQIKPPFEEWAAIQAAKSFDNFLASPEAMQLGDKGLIDPLLLNVTALKSFASSSQETSNDSNSLKYWLTLNTSPLSVTTQDELKQLLTSTQDDLHQIDPQSKISYGGLLRLAAASREHIQKDVFKINILSLVGVIAIVSVFIRRPWNLLKALPIILFALVGSFASCVSIFGYVHIIVLVIGSIIIGISIDYSFHAIFHEKDATSTRKLLFFACLSTVSGALTFLSSELPLIRQIGAFTAAGLLFAFIYSLTLKRYAWEESQRTNVSKIHRLGSIAQILLILATPIALYGISQISWQDDIRNMEATDPELIKEDLELRDRFANTTGFETLLITGNSYLDVLQHADVFDNAHPSSKSFSLARTLSTQSEVNTLIKSPYDLPLFFHNLKQTFHEFGYDTDFFGPFFQSANALTETELHQADFEQKLATLSTLLKGPFAGIIDSDGTLYWSILTIKENTPLGNSPHIARLSNLEFINQSLNGYRNSLLKFGLISTGAVCLLILLFFGIKRGIRIVLIPGISVGLVIGIASLVFGTLNIFHLAGCFLAMALSLDYALFALDAFERKQHIPFSVWLSAATTGASFLALNTSAILVVRSLGFVVCLNTAITLLLLLALSSRFIRLAK